MSINVGSAKKNEPWNHPDPDGGHHHHLNGAQKSNAKRWAAAHNVPYPSLIANMHAAKAAKSGGHK
jgi:hypothetical protein